MAPCQLRPVATCGLQAEAAGAELPASHETVKSFLTGLQYEARKGYTNVKVRTWEDHTTGHLHAATILNCNTSRA